MSGRWQEIRWKSRRDRTSHEQAWLGVAKEVFGRDVANNWSIIPLRVAKSRLVGDKTSSSGRYRVQCSRVFNEYQPLPPVGPLPGGSADNFSLSGIQLDVAGTCSLLIKLRVAAPLPQNSRRVTRPITVGLRLSLARAYRTKRVAFSPRSVLPCRAAPAQARHVSSSCR